MAVLVFGVDGGNVGNGEAAIGVGSDGEKKVRRRDVRRPALWGLAAKDMFG